MNSSVCKYDNATYFHSFGVEHNIKEIKNLRGNKNITIDIFRIKAYNLIMCRYFCIGFTDFMWKDKSLLDYTNLFSPDHYEKNDKKNTKRF